MEISAISFWLQRFVLEARKANKQYTVMALLFTGRYFHEFQEKSSIS